MAAKKPLAKRTAKKPTARKATAKKAPPTKAPAKKPAARAPSASASDWRLATLDRLRGLIREAVPDVVEEVKWRKPSNPDGVPVWSANGILCTGGLFKGYVKLTFAKGALLPDPHRVFNNGFAGNSFRAIDLREGEDVDAAAFKALVREAAALNASKAR